MQIETGAIEFRDPKVERMVALTPADRKWMDDIVKDVNDGYSEEPNISTSMQYDVPLMRLKERRTHGHAYVASGAATTTSGRSSRSTSWRRCRR